MIRFDPAIFGLAFRTQFQKLIVAPLNLTHKGNDGDGIRTPQLILLDGLDECQDPKAQGYILDVITQEIKGCEHLPLLFVITSRPEDHICIKFAAGMLHRITLQLSLEEFYGDHDDIRIFINSGFEEVKQNHPLRHHLPSTWPSPDVIEELVQKSSGQFVYAAMVVDYVSSNRHRPTERLDIIRGLSPHDGDSPFTELDALFKHVFSLVAQRKHALRILSAVILMDLEMSHELVEKLLSLKPGDVRLYLGGLASLIDFHDHRKKITVLHSSLRDFLLDPNRSGDFHIDDKMAHADIAIACLRQLEILGKHYNRCSNFFIHIYLCDQMSPPWLIMLVTILKPTLILPLEPHNCIRRFRTSIWEDSMTPPEICSSRDIRQMWRLLWRLSGTSYPRSLIVYETLWYEAFCIPRLFRQFC